MWCEKNKKINRGISSSWYTLNSQNAHYKKYMADTREKLWLDLGGERAKNAISKYLESTFCTIKISYHQPWYFTLLSVAFTILDIAMYSVNEANWSITATCEFPVVCYRHKPNPLVRNVTSELFYGKKILWLSLFNITLTESSFAVTWPQGTECLR